MLLLVSFLCLECSIILPSDLSSDVNIPRDLSLAQLGQSERYVCRYVHSLGFSYTMVQRCGDERQPLPPGDFQSKEGRQMSKYINTEI